jgi:hypothetical protein
MIAHSEFWVMVHQYTVSLRLLAPQHVNDPTPKKSDALVSGVYTSLMLQTFIWYFKF